MGISVPNWAYLLIGAIGVISFIFYIVFLNSAGKLIDKDHKKNSK